MSERRILFFDDDSTIRAFTRKILYFEDTDTVSGQTSRGSLIPLGWDVYQPEDFHAADSFVRDEPGIDSFEVLLVDLSIPDDPEEPFFTDIQREEMKKLGVNVFLSGWYWLKGVFKDFPSATAKTIVLSAYVDELSEKEKNLYPGVRFLDKCNAASSVSYLEQWLD